MSGFKFTADTKKLRALANAMPDQADRALRTTAEQMTNEIKLSMGTSAAGESYTRRGVTHVASVPGAPPNPDTNTLRLSLKWLPVGRLHYQISDGTDYGLLLEVGTEHIEPRPFMTPVFEAWRGGKFTSLMAGMLA